MSSNESFLDLSPDDLFRLKKMIDTDKISEEDALFNSNENDPNKTDSSLAEYITEPEINCPPEIIKEFWSVLNKNIALSNFTEKKLYILYIQFLQLMIWKSFSKPDTYYSAEKEVQYKQVALSLSISSPLAINANERKLLATQIREQLDKSASGGGGGIRGFIRNLTGGK